jgi:predicted PurR-regulated permease PerM
LVSGAVAAVEAFVAVVLGLIITFFVIKDGNRIARQAQRLLPADRREVAESCCTSGSCAWTRS